MTEVNENKNPKKKKKQKCLYPHTQIQPPQIGGNKISKYCYNTTKQHPQPTSFFTTSVLKCGKFKVARKNQKKNSENKIKTYKMQFMYVFLYIYARQ